jgi:hypothetical protein
MKFNKVKFTNGANKATAETILSKISNDLGYREKAIITDLAEIRQNSEVPNDYIIYEFYNSKGDGFDAGKIQQGYSITN